jgi:hypothetical protein
VVDFVTWPADRLPARSIDANPVAFSRSGGRTIGGRQRVIRSDRGYWSIAASFQLGSTVQRRTWNAVRTGLGGMAGLLILPVWTWDTAPYASGEFEGEILTPHSDSTPFSDMALYAQNSIVIESADAMPIGATTMRLAIVEAEADLAGVRFSYQHAMYETGPASLVSGDIWTVPIFPPVRAPIPAGVELEFNLPTCLVRLADDRGLDMSMNPSGISEHTVQFNEATDYWSDLAAGLLT